MWDFKAYLNGKIIAVCSSLHFGAVLDRLKTEYGDKKWELSKEVVIPGDVNPHPCECRPESHVHYLFEAA